MSRHNRERRQQRALNGKPMLRKTMRVSDVFRQFADLCDRKDVTDKMEAVGHVHDPDGQIMVRIIKSMQWYAHNVFVGEKVG